MRLFGLFFLIVGVMVTMAAVTIGMPFTGVYLLGFIGTGGREAGKELLMFLPTTLGCFGVGMALIKIGLSMRRR